MRLLTYDGKLGTSTTNQAANYSAYHDKAREALNSLPVEERKVIELRLANNSWVRIAHNLGITLYMAKKYHKEGMEKITKKLKKFS
jgi:DNA-directed RNA polymerase specialized sigma24 family protein